MYSRPLSDLLSCLAYPIASEGQLYKDDNRGFTEEFIQNTFAALVIS
jgi:hypothetical protein